MKHQSWLLVDGNYQRIGGVEYLNTSAIQGLAGSLAARRCDLKNVFAEILGHRPTVVIIDLPLTWRRMPTLVLLRVLCRCRRREDISLVIREHNYSRSFEKEVVRHRRRFRWLLRLGYGLMNRVIFVSDAQAEWAREYELCSLEKINVVEHAVEIEDLLKLEGRPPSGTIVFGALARMTFQKGLDVLLEAWKMSGISGQAKLYIGGGGPEEEKLKRYASGIESVEFLGPVTDRRVFYEKCHCIVTPSRWEPYGQVCLEAKAAGCSVIVSDVDGLPGQVESNVSGLIFRSGCSTDLASKIKRMVEIMRTPGRFEGMSSAGRIDAQRTRARFIRDFPKIFSEKRKPYRDKAASRA